MKKKRARSKNSREDDSTIVNAKEKKALSFEDVEKAANFAKQTQRQAKILVGEGTEVAPDVKEFADQSHVLIMRPSNDEPSSS